MRKLRNIIKLMRLASIYVRLIKDPNDTALIFKAVNVLTSNRNEEITRKLEDMAIQDESFRKMYEARYRAKPLNVEELKNLPKDSLGYAVYIHASENNLDLSLFPYVPVHRVVDYMNQRVYEDHDIWHPLFGYNTSVSGEMALQAFGCAQFYSPLGVMLISAGYLHLLGRDPLGAVNAIGLVGDAFRQGRSMRYMLGVPLHDMLHLPLEEVRAACRRESGDLILRQANS